MLYARIFQVDLQPGTTPQAVELFRSAIAPVLKVQPGYVTSRFLTNTAANRCLAVMYWDNEEHRKEAENSGELQEVFNHLAPYFAGQPSIDYYEVAVQTF
ncbi:antibiotic biosynthesis monooxygenase family protein [Hymenobacter jejuensis]|uniref:antibiotic biosynthesis monooxygenase family protein n=1 Tax=Hymenobacter jejuensis TaxID=2502781 RepID=UPI001E5D2A5A|nr:antibiotic biosynthesis monooxygenase [Hymenobacter jejuensis]